MATDRTSVARQQSAPAPAQQQRDQAAEFDVVTLMQLPKARARIEPLVAPGDSYERIVAVVARATRKEPKLLQMDKVSLIDACATICGWHLEIGETAHLVPFKGKVIPIMDYKGMIQILLSSSIVRKVLPSIVREGDVLEIEYGTRSYALHRPVWSADRNKKKIIGVLVSFMLRGQIESFQYMTYEEVDEIRQQYSQSWKSGTVPAWYMIKTAIRQAKKFLATSPELVRAFAVIDAGDEEAQLADPAAEIAPPAPAEDFGLPTDAPQQALAAPAPPQAASSAADDDLEFDRQLAAKEGAR